MRARKPVDIESQLALRTTAAWAKITRELQTMDPHGDVCRAALAKIKAAVKSWPVEVSRPPHKDWAPGDPRLAVCKTVKETATYNDYRMELARSILCKDGTPAIFLERQEVGAGLSHDGKSWQKFGEKGQLDLKGALVVETRSGAKLALWCELEVKMEGGTASLEQRERAQAVNRFGGVAVIAYSIAEAVRELKKFKAEKEGLM